MDGDYTRPFLGAAPAYVRSADRIGELAAAIARAAIEGGAQNYVGHISLQAKEILMQVDIIEFEMKEKHYDIHS